MDTYNVILEQAAKVVAEILGSHDVPTAKPVAARFRDAPSGSSGVAITITLRDRTQAPVVRRMLAERFGSGGVDSFTIA